MFIEIPYILLDEFLLTSWQKSPIAGHIYISPNKYFTHNSHLNDIVSISKHISINIGNLIKSGEKIQIDYDAGLILFGENTAIKYV